MCLLFFCRMKFSLHLKQRSQTSNNPVKAVMATFKFYLTKNCVINPKCCAIINKNANTKRFFAFHIFFRQVDLQYKLIPNET
jgi:hypothetical protein